MEKLAEALAEAIRAGAAIAPTAFLGYYAVRIAEASMPAIGFLGVAGIASMTILKGMKVAATGRTKRGTCPKCRQELDLTIKEHTVYGDGVGD